MDKTPPTAPIDYTKSLPCPFGFERFDWDWFKPIEQCKNVVRKNGEVEFEYIQLDGKAYSAEEIIAEMDSRNLRAALPEEAFGFTECHPYEQKKFTIIILGAVFTDPNCNAPFVLRFDGDRFSPVDVESGRWFSLYYADRGWGNTQEHFLAVRKKANEILE